MYKSQIEQHLEDDIVKAIQNYEIQADKDERIKAMNYDRNQYENEGGSRMTVKEIIDGLKFTIDMFLFDPSTGETYTEPRNDMDKTTIDACKGAIELLERQPCDDCISRQAVLEYNEGSEAELGHSSENEIVCQDIKSLPPVAPKPCDDCISRQATVERLCKVAKFMNEKREGLGSPYVMAALFIQDNKDEFPSVTPKQKTGRWIKSKGYDDRDHFYTCSECGRNINLICGAKLADYPYCHCGARMEVEENG